MSSPSIHKTDLTSSNPHCISAIHRWKHARQETIRSVKALFPQATMDQMPLFYYQPKLDATFCSSSFGRIIKKAVAQLIYYSIVPTQSQKSFYDVLERKITHHGTGYGEVLALLAHSVCPDSPSKDELRHSALFIQLVIIIQDLFASHFNETSSLEVTADMTALETHLESLWKKEGYTLAARHFSKESAALKQALTSNLTAPSASNFIFALISATKTRYFYIEPSKRSFYESGSGRLHFESLDALQKDLYALIDRDQITKGFTQITIV